MLYRYLGNSGLQVSALSLGAWVTYGGQVGEKIATECMGAAYEAGVNFFDNAETYADGEAEVVMGNVIKKFGWKRSDLVLSTKIFWGGKGVNDRGLSRKHIVEGTRAALARFQQEYVDLIYCHRPDPDTPIEETVRAMNWVIEQGWAYYWGTSEWSADQIMEAFQVAKRLNLIPPTMEQPQYSMLHRDRVEEEYSRLYKECGLGTTVWSPLASGLLTGKYDEGIPEGSRLSLENLSFLKDNYESDKGQVALEKVRKLKPIAEKLGCTRAQLALAWCLKNPNVSSVITGASRASQVEDNMGALVVADELSPAVMQSIEDILDNKPKAAARFR